MITLALTGAGKTVSCVVPVLLQHDGPAIVLNLKGKFAGTMRRREMSQDVHVIDPSWAGTNPCRVFEELYHKTG